MAVAAPIDPVPTPTDPPSLLQGAGTAPEEQRFGSPDDGKQGRSPTRPGAKDSSPPTVAVDRRSWSRALDRLTAVETGRITDAEEVRDELTRLSAGLEDRLDQARSAFEAKAGEIEERLAAPSVTTPDPRVGEFGSRLGALKVRVDRLDVLRAAPARRTVGSRRINEDFEKVMAEFDSRLKAQTNAIADLRGLVERLGGHLRDVPEWRTQLENRFPRPAREP